jgi:hypothetical protein
MINLTYGGHIWIVAECPCRRMLLPLRGIETARRVRKNVRFETLRVTSVGKNLRETAYANAG